MISTLLSFQGRTVLKDVLDMVQSSIKHEIDLRRITGFINESKMSDLVRYSVGLDVDKKHVHACMVTMDSGQVIKIKGQRKFENSVSGHKGLCGWISKKHKEESVPVCVTLEPTGVYHEKLSEHMHGQGLSVSIVLGNKVKQYGKSLGLRSKNDRSDARVLARMGAERKLREWMPPSNTHRKLKALTRHKERIENLRTDVRNQMESVKHSSVDIELITSDLEAQMSMLTEQAKKIKKEIVRLVEQKGSNISESVENATSIKGVGPMVAAVVLSETDGFEHFTNERQLMSYVGYDVVENQSGSRQGKTRISKKGTVTYVGFSTWRPGRS